MATLARLLKKKNKPLIIPRDEHNVSRSLISSAAKKVLYRLRDKGHTAYLTGGAVRDILVGKHPKDFDIATDARPEQVKRIFGNSRIIGRRFKIVHVYFKGEVVEVATFRAQLIKDDSHKKNRHFQVHNDGTVRRDNVYGKPDEDAQRRDFTLNALFYDIGDFSIIDYVGGVQDIRNRIVRSLGPPDERFTEDPVRMIRALRYAAALDFQIEEETSHAILQHRDKLKAASPSRLFEEICKDTYAATVHSLYKRSCEAGVWPLLFEDLDAFNRRLPEGAAWVDHVYKQLQKWNCAGLYYPKELALALIFAIFHEELTAMNGIEEVAHGRAIITGHLQGMKDFIHIPQNIIDGVCSIHAMQPLLADIEKTPLKTITRQKNFHEAYLFFKVRNRYLKRWDAVIRRWDEFLLTS